jgi:hypothetical protein
MGAMAFLPAGYALAGPVSDAIGISATLWIGAAWIVVSTLAVLSVSSVRGFHMHDATRSGATAAAPANA